MARNCPNSASHYLRQTADHSWLKFMENGNSFSIHAWVKLASTSGDQTILSKYPSSSRGFLMRTNAGKLGCFWIDGASAGQEAISATSFSAGVWTSVGCHYNFSTRTMTARFNGVADGTDSSGFNIHGSYTAEWRAGLRANGTNPLNGDIAEISMWGSRELNDSEWAALAKGVPASRAAPAGLTPYWPLWGLGSDEPDFSPSALPWTLVSTTVVDHAPVRSYA